MKKETIDKIEGEINKKTTMPDSLKGKTRKEVFINLVLAIGIILYFIFLIMGSVDSTKISRTLDFRIFSLVLLFIAICLFEIAYKKDSGKIAINGIEILVVALITLFFPYIIFELDRTHQKYYFMVSGYISIYYIIKSIIITNRAKIKYEKQESDIKEIVKKEEKKTEYLDEEIEEKTAKKDKKTTKNDEEISKKNIATKKPEKRVIKTEEDKIDSKPKKRGRPKKIVEELDNNEKVEKETNKKTKTTIKHVTTVNEQKDEEKPKKRGRPRKVVES